MNKPAQFVLERCRVWSAEHACFWWRQWQGNPTNDFELLYRAAHNIHLFFYLLRLPWELQLTAEAKQLATWWEL